MNFSANDIIVKDLNLKKKKKVTKEISNPSQDSQTANWEFQLRKP